MSAQEGDAGKGGPESSTRGNEPEEGKKGQDKRTGAEWVTLGASVLIVLALAGLVLYQQFTQGTKPPTIQIEPKLNEMRQEGDAYYLPVEVTNTGEKTAESIEVQFSLDPGEGEPEAAAFSVQFLAGGESENQTIVFQSDPSKGKLTHVVAFSVP